MLDEYFEGDNVLFHIYSKDQLGEAGLAALDPRRLRLHFLLEVAPIMLSLAQVARLLLVMELVTELVMVVALMEGVSSKKLPPVIFARAFA